MAQNLVQRVISTPLDSSWHITCLEPLLSCQIMRFQVLELWLHLKETFLGLGLTVTEINIKKVQKQEIKNIKNVKRCRDGMPKGMIA